MAVYGLLLGSGAAGLAYEVSWARQLGLVFGQTARAAAVVLAAYFLGMALGYALAGRLSARSRRPLLGFAVAEFVVGAWAFAVPACLALTPSSIPPGPSRFILALLVLLPGTTAMGASLPFVAQAVGSSAEAGTKRIARVYAANLGGAVVGVAVSSLWMLAQLGVTATSYAAAAVSMTVSLLAWVLRDRFVTSPAPRAAAPAATHSSWTWILAAAISGYGTLAAQVLYMRLFALVFHNSTYTFAAILLVVLLALSLSSLLGSFLVRRFDARLLLVAAALVVAIALPLSAYLFVDIRGFSYFTRGSTFSSYIVGVTGLVSAVVAVPMLAMGVILPLSWHLAGADHEPGRVVGRLTTANTVAAAAGAILASFVLLPQLGLWASFASVSFAYLLLAGMVVPGLSHSRRVWALGLAVCLVAIFGLARASALHQTVPKRETLVERFTGAYGWVDVTHDPKRKDLLIRQNFHYTLGAGSASAMELRQGHLPLLLHDQPKQVAFIGLATGTTASAALDYPEVERITVMELVPEVVEAARHFTEQNGGVLDDPRLDLIVDDGRRVLGSADDQYDVIVSDLFVPWESKTGYLYTVEHFEAVQKRLADDGLFCLWLAGWQVGPNEFDIIAQSMQTVFEHVAIWQFSRKLKRPLFALVGTDAKRTLSRDQIAARLERRRSLPVGRDDVLRKADDIVAWYLGDWESRPATPLNTDEHPIIEFNAPKTHRNRGERLKNDAYKAFYEQRLSGLERSVFSFDPPATPEDRRVPR